ncbi:glycosyltransferase [Variovorax sp. J22R24]|uniref:glycosyltransferase n=1 Tax=Variovorax gracilis TaxID=3053502 RepID=UPI0025763426|nr:glycosyltransferase [Variovorax sp. J22R24]MDM0108105.1 glycosyltransferase [Variovorax sp. J22R24]
MRSIAVPQRLALPLYVQNLVFVGPALHPDQMALAARHGVADRIATFQKVPHRELRVLYARATALLFPSLQEGFGWPLIEAQACGCPVITSDLAPMNEIGGPGACYVDPHDPEGIARAIEQAAARFEQMRALGLDNVRHYSTARMTSSYVAAYRGVLMSRRPVGEGQN